MKWAIGLKTFGWSVFAVALSALVCLAGRPFLPTNISTADFTIFGAIVASIIAPAFLFPWILQAARSEKLQRRLETLAFTDELTGVANRRGFFGTIRECCDLSCLPSNSAVMMVDLDHFKKINDTFGHEAGDIILARVSGRIASTLGAFCGASAIIGRMGGEEFGIVVLGIHARDASRLAEALCDCVRTADTLSTARGVRQTISIGVVADAGGLSLDTALSRADDAAYEAKVSGRDRWCRAKHQDYLSDSAIAFPSCEAKAA